VAFETSSRGKGKGAGGEALSGRKKKMISRKKVKANFGRKRTGGAAKMRGKSKYSG